MIARDSAAKDKRFGDITETSVSSRPGPCLASTSFRTACTWRCQPQWWSNTSDDAHRWAGERL